MEALADMGAKKYVIGKQRKKGEGFSEKQSPEERVLDQWYKKEAGYLDDIVVKLAFTRSIETSGLFSKTKKEFKVEYDGEVVARFPSSFKELYKEIENSKYILDLGDNWDDNGAKGYKFETWSKAISFLVKYNKWTHEKTGEIVAPPKIYHGPEGSIDLLWKTEEYQLLVKIPENDAVATFYGDDYDSTNIEGSIDIKGRKNDGFIFSLLHFS